MGFKSDMTEHLNNASQKIQTESEVYVKLGKNPLDVTYDTSKFKHSLLCIEHFTTKVSELADDDAVLSVTMPKLLIEEIKNRLEDRKKLAEEDDMEDGILDKKAEANAWIAVCEDLAVMTSIFSSKSASRLQMTKVTEEDITNKQQ